MARPVKRGLDYFPLDTDTDNDSALAYIEAKHGIVGYAVYLKLLQRIYGEEGYYMPWNDRERVLVAKRAGVDEAVMLAVVNDCVAEGLFDSRLLADFDVLTSRSIQERFVNATARRTNNAIREELMLTETPVDGGLLLAKSTQSKGKEIESELNQTSDLTGEEVTDPVDNQPRCFTDYHQREISKALVSKYTTDVMLPEILGILADTCPKRCNGLHAISCSETACEVIAKTRIAGKVPEFIRQERSRK
jgi:hypothetical protein